MRHGIGQRFPNGFPLVLYDYAMIRTMRLDLLDVGQEIHRALIPKLHSIYG